MSRRPGRAEGEFGRRTAVEIPHAARQRGIGAIERPRECGTKHPKALLGRIDLDPGVYGQEVVQACRVVAVTVRDNHEVDGSQIDPQGADILGEDIRVVPSVEEDPLPVVLNERCEAPVPGEAGAAPEGIVKDRNAVGRSQRGGVRGKYNSSCQNEAHWMGKSHVANSSQSLTPEAQDLSRVRGAQTFIARA